MIKDIINYNEKVSPNDREMSVLRENFPSCFKSDGSFDIERFKEFLSDKVTVTHEGYELKFLGKNYASLLVAEETTTVILPDVEHNSRPENANSENIYISADNLDALKHLLKSYAGCIKCIYIDPPYNTGSDGFVYNDSFHFTAEELSARLSVDIEQAERILDLTKRGSASHSAWLMFMYPRLLLARDLLDKDGVIFISIDDNEQANMKLLCDEVFGEENFITEIVWQKKKGGGNDSRYVAVEHEYIAVYGKSLPNLDKIFISYDDGYTSRYNEVDDKGRYFWDTFKRKSGKQYYPITCPDGSILQYEENGEPISWLRSEARFKSDLQEGEVKFVNINGKWNVHFKQRMPLGYKPRSILSDYGTTASGADEVNEIFNRTNIFSNPKPSTLIEHLVKFRDENDAIILDFFSGSATTAHSVMNLNAEDGGHRKYILVQLPEETDTTSEAYKAGYHKIDEIGQERIKRAAAKIREGHPETTADLGFKHYTLYEPSTETLDKLESFSPDQMFTNLLDEFGVPTVLTTWLVRDGYGFTAKYETLDFAGYEAYYFGKHLYLINEGLSDEAITAICEKLESDATFNPENIVLFGYSFTWGMRDTLQINVKRLKDTEKNLRVNFDVRY